jgi:hypothetical protein
VADRGAVLVTWLWCRFQLIQQFVNGGRDFLGGIALAFKLAAHIRDHLGYALGIAP